MRPKIHIHPMTRRTLRIPTTLADAVDLYAAKHGVSANAAVIELLEQAISSTPARAEP